MGAWGPGCVALWLVGLAGSALLAPGGLEGWWHCKPRAISQCRPGVDWATLGVRGYRTRGSLQGEAEPVRLQVRNMLTSEKTLLPSCH